MRETIEHILETEKSAADIIAAAEKKAAEIISKNDAIILEKLNNFREQEYNRYNEAIEQAELEKKNAIEKIRNEDSIMNADLEAISNKVLKHIMKTVFD